MTLDEVAVAAATNPESVHARTAQIPDNSAAACDKLSARILTEILQPLI